MSGLTSDYNSSCNAIKGEITKVRKVCGRTKVGTERKVTVVLPVTDHFRFVVVYSYFELPRWRGTTCHNTR